MSYENMKLFHNVQEPLSLYKRGYVGNEYVEFGTHITKHGLVF
jgi:hypothetical protein